MMAKKENDIMMNDTDHKSTRKGYRGLAMTEKNQNENETENKKQTGSVICP